MEAGRCFNSLLKKKLRCIVCCVPRFTENMLDSMLFVCSILDLQHQERKFNHLVVEQVVKPLVSYTHNELLSSERQHTPQSQ